MRICISAYIGKIRPVKKNSLIQAVLNLEQGNFKIFTSGTDKNMGFSLSRSGFL